MHAVSRGGKREIREAKGDEKRARQAFNGLYHTKAWSVILPASCLGSPQVGFASAVVTAKQFLQAVSCFRAPHLPCSSCPGSFPSRALIPRLTGIWLMIFLDRLLNFYFFFAKLSLCGPIQLLQEAHYFFICARSMNIMQNAILKVLVQNFSLSFSLLYYVMLSLKPRLKLWSMCFAIIEIRR